MKVQCDVCKNGEASVMCCADEAALCAECDRRIHTANKLASKHQRVGLSLPTSAKPTCCDICQDKVGFFFCLEDRALLCRSCDYSIHSTNALTAKHKRFLVCGIRVALEASPIANESAESTRAFPSSQIPSPTMKTSELSFPKIASLSKVTGTVSADSQESCRMASLLSLMPQQSVVLKAQNHISHEQAEDCGINDAESKRLHQAPRVAGSGQEVMVVLPSNLASVPVNPFDHQVHVNSNWELHPSIAGVLANNTNVGRAVATQTGGGFVRKSSISEYLTQTIPGWRVDDLLNFTDASSTRNFADCGLSKKDTWSFVDTEWQADSTVEELQVPALPSPPPSSGVARSTRWWGLGKTMKPSDLNCFFHYDDAPDYDDAPVVPDIGALTSPSMHLPTLPHPKKRRIEVDF